MNTTLMNVLIVLGGTVWGMFVFAICVGYVRWQLINTGKELINYHMQKRTEFIRDFEKEAAPNAG